MILFKKRKRKERKDKTFKPPPARYFIFTSKKIFQLLVVPLLVILMILFFNSPLFRIKKIECYKLDFPCSLKENEFFTPLIGKSIFFTSIGHRGKEIKKANFKIKKIKIKKILPDKIRIEIIPRVAIANLTADKKDFFIVDEEGFIFEKQRQPLANLPLVLFDEKFTLSTGVFFKGKVENILELILTLKRKLINSSFIELTGIDGITLVLDSKTIATISARKNYSEQLDSLQLILSRSKIEGKLPKKIDLRFEKPVVVY